MEPSIYRYVLKHTFKDQIYLILLTVVSLPLVYITLEVPKRIINEAIGGQGAPYSILGFDLDQIGYLLVLCFFYLGLVILNGGFKYVNNVYRGVVGERMLRRFRYELYNRILRFPLPHFKRTSQGELIPMIVAETEPLGGFIGEAFALPAFQGGMLLTYLSFIFVQDVFLGIASIMMYPLQMYVIPKLQRKVNNLNKQRVRKVRTFSDRIGETVSGITEIHAHNTSRFARANVGNILGGVFHIRYDVYRRKFFIKFLNNFLDKITPFFFYSVGGYLVITGELSLGALVAALAAYKDISDPWKTLLKYYQTKEDVRVKYSQIIEQFQPENMLTQALLDEEPKDIPPLTGSLNSTNLSYSEDGTVRIVDGVSFGLDTNTHVMTVGLGNSGKDELAMLLARLIQPTGGRVVIDNQNVVELPEAVLGRRMAYVGQNAYVFAGTIRDNLFYGLKHRPVTEPEYDEEAKKSRERELKAAIAADNSSDNVLADWIDYEAAGVAHAAELEQKALGLAELVDMENDLYQLGLRGRLDPNAYPELIERILVARDKLGHRLQEPELEGLVQSFNRDLYNTNMSVAENLLFGSALIPAFTLENLATNTDVRQVLDAASLTEDMVRIGKQVAETMIELFADVDPDSELFEKYSFISADDLPGFAKLLARAEEHGVAGLDEEERIRLLSLTFKLVPSQHRLGLVDEQLQARLIDARHALAERLATMETAVAAFDSGRFNAALSLQDNILFGRPNPEQARAQTRIGELIAETVDELDLHQAITKVGLDYEVGIGGSRLSLALRQKLAIARCLLKDPDVFIINQATSALDPGAELQLVKQLIEYRKDQSLIWVSDRAELARYFDRVMVMDSGKIREQGTFEELSSQGALFPQLVGAT
jgi:ABC-type multidrug transport system fused ATPase/permease subunit